MEYRVLKLGEPDYPAKLKERLGKEAPTLYARGDLSHVSRWTLTFLTADQEPGNVIRALWYLFLPVLEYEMNALGPWQSVNEGVFFRSALEKPWISLSLFTAKGIEKETFESFLDSRNRPPFHEFLQKPEYRRRAAEGELLLLSISSPTHTRQSRDVILKRNWIACHMADVVFIGGASKIVKEWKPDEKSWRIKRQKTFALARDLARTGIPVFTVQHEDNRELLDLGVPGLTPEGVGAFLESHGARRSRESDLKRSSRPKDSSPGEVVTQPDPRPVTAPRQLRLGGFSPDGR